MCKKKALICWEWIGHLEGSIWQVMGGSYCSYPVERWWWLLSAFSIATTKYLKLSNILRKGVYLVHRFGGWKSKIGQPHWFGLWWGALFQGHHVADGITPELHVRGKHHMVKQPSHENKLGSPKNYFYSFWGQFPSDVPLSKSFITSLFAILGPKLLTHEPLGINHIQTISTLLKFMVVILWRVDLS